MPSPAFPGMFFAFAAMALLVFVSVSPPAWTQVNFLTATAGGQVSSRAYPVLLRVAQTMLTASTTTSYGMLGYCTNGACSSRNVGYDITLPGSSGLDLNSTALHRLTYALVLHAVAGFFALVAFLMGLCGIAIASRTATIMMAFFAFFAGAITIFIFVVDIVIFTLTRNAINAAGYDAMLGNANWLTLGAAVSLFLSFCTSTCGACGRFASGRAAGEKY